MFADDMIYDVLFRIYRDGKIESTPQPQGTNYPTAPKPNEENTRIYWNWGAQRVHNLVRGWYDDFETFAHTTLLGNKIYVTETKTIAPSASGRQGEIVGYREIGEEEAFEVYCPGDYNLLVLHTRYRPNLRYNMPNLIGRIQKQEQPVILGR